MKTLLEKNDSEAQKETSQLKMRKNYDVYFKRMDTSTKERIKDREANNSFYLNPLMMDKYNSANTLRSFK